MTANTAPAPIAVRREIAAEMLAMSVDAFDEHVRPDLRVVRRGRLVLYPVAELQRWVEKNAARALEAA